MILASADLDVFAHELEASREVGSTLWPQVKRFVREGQLSLGRSQEIPRTLPPGKSGFGYGGR